MSRILGIESTCDETAAAVVVDGRRVLSSVVATQSELHARFRGVVPEIASRAHLQRIEPVILQALQEAPVTLADIDAVAVAHRPGLIGSLLIGVTAAKTLAWCIGRPLIGVDHVHAHLYSPLLETDLSLEFPAVGMVCSGGHTAMYRLGSFLDVELIGTTLDDAVGEAYDKVAAILGLAYPGGPVIDQLARHGDPASIAFPRSMLEPDSLDFSFSGLKTSVLYHVRSAKPPREKENIAAAFQAACVDVLVAKLHRAARRLGARSVIVGGGVSSNSALRAALAAFPLKVHLPLPKYCTDNAAMSAGLAELLLQNGRVSPLDLDAVTYSQFKE